MGLSIAFAAIRLHNGSFMSYKKEKREPHHAHSAIRGPETAIATERAMVESPRVV